MQFRTKISILTSENQLDYNSKIVSLGSCFAVNIAEKLGFFKFQNTCNPFGILFHPLAIEKLIDFAISKKVFTDHDVFFFNERWHSFDVHSDFSHSNKEELITTLNTILSTVYQQIIAATHIVITYGTAWVYRNTASNSIVANCHKVPQKQFSKEILSVETIQKSIQHTIQLIQKVNSKVSFIFTVSPVRHIKDGFVENQISKAHLIAALYQIQKFPSADVNYFPSYEIMMDELRDYRFYDQDMLHPNQVAIDYIWERFSETHISPKIYAVMEEITTIQKGLTHRSFNPQSDAHQQFLSKLQDRMLLLQNNFPHISF